MQPLIEHTAMQIVERLTRYPIKDYKIEQVMGVFEDGSVDYGNFRFENDLFYWAIDSIYTSEEPDADARNQDMSELNAYFKIEFTSLSKPELALFPFLLAAAFGLRDDAYELRCLPTEGDGPGIIILGGITSNNNPAKLDEYVSVLEAMISLAETFAMMRKVVGDVEDHAESEED